MALELLNAEQEYLVYELLGDDIGPMVPGEGQATRPRVMLVGEAPGAQEVREGRPFVGQAGKNLNSFLAALGLERDAIYVTNVVKMRPTKTGPSGRLSNRPPTSVEITAFLPWLLAEVDRVNPQMVVSLGNTPLRALAGEGHRIGDCHGRLMRSAGGRRLFPLYHPAAVIYNRALMSTYLEDLEALRLLLEKPADFLLSY